MKKTGLAKSDAKKLMGKMAVPGAAGFGKGDKTAEPKAAPTGLMAKLLAKGTATK